MSGYPCDQCDYKATVKNDLLRHIKSRHEGVKYPCNQCDYNTTQKTYYLLTHTKSKHKGVKYPCDQCDHKATQRYALSKHQNIWVSSILVISVILKQHRWRTVEWLSHFPYCPILAPLIVVFINSTLIDLVDYQQRLGANYCGVGYQPIRLLDFKL